MPQLPSLAAGAPAAPRPPPADAAPRGVASLEERRSRAEIDQFAYAASHDLQEPLRMVKGFLRLFVERYGPALDDEGRALVQDALDGADRAQRMLNDLLDYSRVETREARMGPVDLDDCLAQALQNLRFSLQEAQAEVRHDRLPAVQGDEGLLERLFQNLVGNAIKFRGPHPPIILVSAAREGPMWHVRVQDNGIGIEPRHIPSLFQPFRRLHSTDRYPGTGMGLAISRKIVEAHGGQVWITSDAGGTCVHFTLPERRP